MIPVRSKAARKPKPKPRRKPPHVEANTFGLPRGEPIRRELRAVFEAQRREILAHLDPRLKSGRTLLRKDDRFAVGPLPEAWPPFRLGNLAMSERMKIGRAHV